MTGFRMLTIAAALAVTFANAVSAHAAPNADPAAPPVDVPYKEYTLKNGLTLLVHEDRKAPIVAVNVWYHVGSKNERAGRTGFAHLFEHLMFNGSEHFNDDWFKAMDRIGATNLNGTTNTDRTNYFQNVPKTALDTVLWLESDRMGHLLGAIDQAKLDEQRGVVQNEKRQGENQPYGQVYNLVFENAFPKGHPYSWPVIGYMEDLQAAKLDDVHEWFKTYYGAANATLVVAGDVDAVDVRARVEKYFGAIPAGPALARHDRWIAKRSGEHRQVLQDRVPQARIYMVWNIPEFGHADVDYLDLAASVLADGKTSRLYERLVYRDKIATDVAAFAYAMEAAGIFVIQATAQPGGDLAAVEAAVREELARFLDKGPTSREMKRVQTETRAAFIRGLERVGGFGGKSDLLASYKVFTGDPGRWKDTYRRYVTAKPADVKRATREWLADGVFALEVRPYPGFATSPDAVDRQAVPQPESFPAGEFPARETATLKNGLKVVFARRTAIPVVEVTLMVDAGFVADAGGFAGTASLASNMLDEGTQSRDALEINDEAARLGAQLGTGDDLDASYVFLSALKENLDPSLALFADVTLNPTFPADDFGRLKQQRLAQIQREKVTPSSMAYRLFPKLAYGAGHPYAMPFTGSGDEASVQSITRETLAEFHRRWFKPNNATLVVVGDTTLAEILPLLEKHLGGWQAGPVPEKSLPSVEARSGSIVYLVDRPDSIQSQILAGHLAPPKAHPDDLALDVMNQVLGATFSSRINMNLREDKHWSYGARSSLFDAVGPRPFVVNAPVQTDKTAEAMLEVKKELEGIVGARPATAAELAVAKDKRVLTLPGRWETLNAVEGDLLEELQYGLPENYWNTLAARVGALALDDINRVARAHLRPGALVWVVIGDLKKIEAPIRAAGFIELRIVDVDGNPVPAH